jgi:type IV pilus assembly protein PilY1
MKLRNLLLYCAALVLAVLSLSARAEDIDLFTGTRADQTVPPNLLLIVGNAAHSSSNAGMNNCVIDGVTSSLSGTALGVEQCALYYVISTMDLTNGPQVKLGVMTYNANGLKRMDGRSCNSSKLGGCLLYPLTTLDAVNRPLLLNWIKSWGTTYNIKGDNEATGGVMQEAWAYFYGQTGLSGDNYASIAPSIDCKNFVVFVSDSLRNNASPGDGGSASVKQALFNAPEITQTQKNMITFANGVTPAATVCGSLGSVPGTENLHENNGFYADEWARYMNAKRITTYTVGLLDYARCVPEYPWLLSSMASHGGGTYFPTTDYQTLVDALLVILSEVRSVNSVFAAVSLPVSVNSQGTYLNQVFIGMFRPDPGGLPRWFGNLKQYKMGFLGGAFSMLDASDKLAISASGSEFIGECARSYWTPTPTAAGDGYWSLLTTQNCAGYDGKGNSPDGNMVEKGAQAYMLRSISPDARVVKTCPSTMADCQTAMTEFSTSNNTLTTTTFGVTPTSGVTTTTLVDWARGKNNHFPFPETASVNGSPISQGASSTHMRPSSHGDVVHSRPAAVNFGTDANPKVVVFYGGNDGMLRAINGNRTLAITANGATVQPGAEFWSFVPPEFHSKLLRRYKNAAPDAIDAALPKDYAMDGPITAYRQTPTSDVWLYVGMRRGGRTLYAFQVDKDTLAITLKWKIGCMDDANTNCNPAAKGDYSSMAQTWSAPQIFTAKGVDNGTTPLMIVGGGYDPACEDTLSYSCASTRGNRYYVINATTGVRVGSFNTARGVLADVTIVPDSDGTAKYIYGADLGGNVYRISGPHVSSAFTPIGTNAVGDWVITTVASLGCDASNTCTTPPNRKFFFAPDVVVDGADYVLLLGSGDREKPTRLSNPTSNYFFMIKDRPEEGNAYLNDGRCTGMTGLCLAALHGITQGTTPTQAELDAKKGWYLRLATSEQVVTGAIAVFGTVYFTTHEPKAAASNSCVPNLGTSRAYGVKYTNASASRTSGDLFIERLDAGLAPDLVVGKVTLDARDGSATVPFCIGCDGPIKPSQPVAPGLVNNPAKIRSYWYIQK